MAFRVDDFQKQARFPEEGTPEFMAVMGRSLKAYDAALDLLIEVMELLRESFMEMVEIHYGLSVYEEFLKDNRAAEKAKEMRPDMVEREMLSEEDHEKQEEDRAMQKEDPDLVQELEGISQQEEKRRGR